MTERIIDVNSFEQYKDDMQKYMIYTSRRRVMPEFRDGLKPVHRKIMYCMYADEQAITHYIKSMAVVGSVLKLYHPHGDSAVYGAMKPLVNWFEINKPLIDKQGNFGTFKGSTAAASRYTEVKLSKFALDCIISELQESKQVVDWTPTYDEMHLEPEYLPASVPVLLINGAFGIGVGMKVEIPRHNMNEVIDATINLIENPDTVVELVPDHCMVCDIVKTNFKTISNKGSGSYTVRGIINIEEYKGRQALVITSIPDLTFLNGIKDKIEDLIKDNTLVQIQDTADESSTDKKNGDRMRYVIVLKKGSDPNYVKQVIYKKTEMEQTCRVNFEVLDGINPMRMSYKSYLLAFIEFRKLTKFRLYCNRLQYVETKMHEREIYIKVLKSGEIDNIIHMIRNQTDIDDNKLIEYLIAKLYITDLQAKFVLGTDIRKLSKGYLNKYIAENIELEKLKKEYMIKITDDSVTLQEIKEELLEYKAKYGNKRRCKVISEGEASGIPEGQFKIVITENNFIKKLPLNDVIGSFKGDSPKSVISVDNTENILIFDELGKVFKLPANKVAFSDRSSSGTDIRMLIKNLTSNINTVIPEATLKDFNSKQNKYFMVVVTTQGYIKKLDIDDFLTVPPSGVIYIKLDNGDTVKSVMVIAEKSDVIIYSDSKALRMNMSEVPHLKRSTKGNRCMSTNEPIDGISLIKHDTTDIVVVTESGMVNRFNHSGLALSTRGKTGVTVIKLSKTDKIKCIFGINSRDSLHVITKNDKMVIPIVDIPEGSSISAGTKVVSMKGDIIIKCNIIKHKK